jgi:hypothetical protein
MSETNYEPELEGEDEDVLTIFYWWDDEPADEDELWAAAMYDDWEGPKEEPLPRRA